MGLVVPPLQSTLLLYFTLQTRDANELRKDQISVDGLMTNEKDADNFHLVMQSRLSYSSGRCTLFLSSAVFM